MQNKLFPTNSVIDKLFGLLSLQPFSKLKTVRYFLPTSDVDKKTKVNIRALNLVGLSHDFPEYRFYVISNGIHLCKF